MANRRMFEKSIITSDNFMTLSYTAQILYFHLIANADDDGFIGNIKGVLRMADKTEKDLAELQEAGLVLAVNRVMVITHWHIHNKVRKDMYNPTQYQAEYDTLIVDKGNVYHLKKNMSSTVSNESSTEPVQDLYKTCTDSERKKEIKESNEESNKESNQERNQDDDESISISSLNFEQFEKTWNTAAEKNSMVKVDNWQLWSEKRKKELTALCSLHSIPSVLHVIATAGESDFLGKANKKGWAASFDWIIRPENFEKVREGNYKTLYGTPKQQPSESAVDDWFLTQIDEMRDETVKEMVEEGKNSG